MSQTLAGHIEDLGLDEVVRVIALSKRSGVLSVHSAGSDDVETHAEVIFLKGRVVNARRLNAKISVIDALRSAGFLDDTALDDDTTLESILQRSTNPHDAQGEIRQRLLKAATHILQTQRGRFAFDVQGEPALLPPAKDMGFTVVEGIDNSELIQARTQSEISDPLQSIHPTASDDKIRPELLLCSPDAEFVAHAKAVAEKAGLDVRLFDSSASLTLALPELGAQGPERAVVCDLVQPRSHGRGILGGLEILQRAADEGQADRVFLMLEGPHKDAEQIAAFMGAGDVMQKGFSRTDPVGFINPILFALGHEELPSAPVDMMGRLHRELNDDVKDEWRPDDTAFPSEGSLTVLKTLLEELNDPKYEEEIPLLVLRFASAFFSRGALFQTDSQAQRLSGIGGFGLGGDDVGRKVHGIHVPMNTETLFSKCLAERREVRQPYVDSVENQRFLSKLGNALPREYYCAPLLSNRGVEAVLYADNAIDLRAFPDVELLEIFLQQSGAALERWSLKRELQELKKELAART